MSAFHHTREIRASAQALFQSLSDPARLARWWGPDGFTNTIHRFEFRPGGAWELTMHGPDGASYPNRMVFTEIIPGASVVIRHGSQPIFQLSIGLTPSGDGTVVSWHQEFEDPAVAAAMRPIAEPANEQNLTRWAREVADFAKGRGPDPA